MKRAVAPPSRVRGRPRATVRPASLALLALLLAPAAAPAGQALAPYETESDLLATTPSTDAGALGAMFNPAQWGAYERPELAFFWSDAGVRPHAMDNWGFAMGRGLGLSLRRHDLRTPSGPRSVTDWQIGAGGGTAGAPEGAGYTGLAFGFSGAGKGLAGRRSFISAGQITRPARWLSIGSATQFALGGDDIQDVTDVGLRPLGTPRLQLFADYALRRRQHWDGGALAGGLSLRPVDGLEAAFKLREGGAYQIAFSLTIDRAGARAVPHYDSGGRLGTTNYVVRTGPPVRGVPLERRLLRNRRLLEMDLHGQATYQSYVLWDASSLPLRSITSTIQAALDDPTVAGVALNLSGFDANPSMIWEVREKILALRRAGKTCVVYADGMGMSEYYLATAADRIVLDPQGVLVAPGVVASRTYLKDALTKLGLGVDEWRFFKYKSAFETLSRRDMSDADREQWRAYVDESYEEYASGIVASGRTTRADFDSVVNHEPLLDAPRLRARGWVDTLAHWEDVRGIAERLAGHRLLAVSRRVLEARDARPDETWGEVPAVALVYAVGECAMDTGIRGRETSRALREFRGRHDVKAVVLRADSPGGEALPSDLVAHEMQKLHEARKPVLVSQGRVAASGGYWISMDADRISTSPFTLTGSIGVIGGWVWDDGFGKKLGLTSDRVQVGKSADLFGGLRLPILGTNLPERNLDEGEREQAKRLILDAYDEFTTRVAKARHLDVARVREIAQGRVWMGRAARKLRLVDSVATLDETIEEAKREAGIGPGRRVRIIEYPKRELFRLPGFLTPGIQARQAAPDPVARTLEASVVQQILDHPGRPLLLVPSEMLPDERSPAR